MDKRPILVAGLGARPETAGDRLACRALALT